MTGASKTGGLALRAMEDELDAFIERGRAGPGILGGVIERLSEGLGAGVLAHRPELTAAGWASEQMLSSSDPLMTRVAALTLGYLPRAPLRYAHYDPLTVEPGQRNRVLPDTEIRAFYTEPHMTPVVREVYQPAGVCELQHTRVVISDGPFMLCWLGLWREEPFSAEETQVIVNAVPKLGARLAVERLLWGGTPGSFDAVGQTLELLGRPAFVVNAVGQLVFVNSAGRHLIDDDRSMIDDVSEAAMRGVALKRIHSVTRVGSPGTQNHFIVLATAEPPAADARLRAVVEAHRLTETQARVMQLLVRGEANKDIATRLQCAPRTVELHVTAVLKKCNVESRSRLIAWFWTRG